MGRFVATQSLADVRVQQRVMTARDSSVPADAPPLRDVCALATLQALAGRCIAQRFTAGRASAGAAANG
jgi:hypothetical protein